MKAGLGKLVNLGMFFVCLCSLSNSAHADTFTFSVSLPSGTPTFQGTLLGTIDLPFITSATGSGTGAAASLILTSIPSGFGTLAAGNVVTNWFSQASNTFTVVNGVVTSNVFFAVGTFAQANALCLNTTGASLGSGVYSCNPFLNELNENFTNFGYKAPGDPILLTADITPPTTVIAPEPGTLALVGTGLGGLVAAMRRRVYRCREAYSGR